MSNPNDPMLALQKASRITPGPEMMRGEMPLDPAFLKSLGKPVAELLGTVFKTKTGSGLPSLLRMTNWDARTGNVGMHSLRKAGEAFEASPTQIDEMIERGWLDLEQPAEGASDHIRKLLQKILK